MAADLTGPHGRRPGSDVQQASSGTLDESRGVSVVAAPDLSSSALASSWRRLALQGLRLLLGVSGFSIPWLALADPAKADLEICSSRKSNRHIDVAIGYRNGDDWVSEGWWKIPPYECVTPVAGDLQVRYYYVRAVEWGTGKAWEDGYTFCVDSKPFTIVGDSNCESRGFSEEGFLQYDCDGDSYCRVTIWPEKVSFLPSPVDRIVAQRILAQRAPRPAASGVGLMH